MKRNLVVLATTALLSASFSIFAPAVVQASTLEIHFTGLNLHFDGNSASLYDSTDANGGNGLPSQSDPLVSMQFILDGNLIGSFTQNIFADVAIYGIPHIPVAGGVVQAQGGGFDLLTSSAGWGLALALDNLTLFYTGGQLAISGATAATEIYAQNLPFQLSLEQPIDVLFILGGLTNVTDNGQWLTGFDGSGTGVISGTAVPEPATLLLVGAGLLGASSRLRRRQGLS